MSDLLLKRTVLKKVFNKVMMDKFGYKNIYVSNHKEEDGTKVTLYYLDSQSESTQVTEDLHIGSWCKGKGWIFSDAQPHLI